MNKEKFSPYATNKGGRISAPKSIAKDEPRATRTVGDYLRAKRKRGA